MNLLHCVEDAAGDDEASSIPGKDRVDEVYLLLSLSPFVFVVGCVVSSTS